MVIHPTPGLRLREYLRIEKPLQIAGTINAYSALLAEQAGFKALYLSGAGVANASLGLPDLGINECGDILADLTRIVAVTDLPVLVDIDTGFGDAFNISRTIKRLEKAGAAAVHIEDQVQQKRCGHRPGKMLVSNNEMVERIKIACDARNNEHFAIMARTDALASEGIERMIERAQAYVDAGADMIFAEAVETLDQYRIITESIHVPVLANITEFGKTPLFTIEELASVGVSMALYPLSAFRAMNKAAEMIYKTIKQKGTQQSVISLMQTRDALYKSLDYYNFEEKMDTLL